MIFNMTTALSITALIISSYFVAHSNCFQFHHRALLRRPRAYESKHLKSAYGASILRSSSSGNDESTSKTNPSSELEELQNELWLIEAIEARNAAQVFSMVGGKNDTTARPTYRN